MLESSLKFLTFLQQAIAAIPITDYL